MPSPNRPSLLFETLLLSFTPLLLNQLFPSDPLFLSWLALPYVLTGGFSAGFNGWRWGLVALGLAPLWGLLFWWWRLGPEVVQRWLWSWQALTVGLALGLAALLAAELVRRQTAHGKGLFLQRLRTLVHRSLKAERRASLVERVNRVLEGRVAGQHDSITLLRRQIHKLEALGLEEALTTLLETLAQFTGLTAASLWCPDESGQRLLLRKTWGPGLRPAELDAFKSIPGWTLRNSSLFSLRQLRHSVQFANLELGSCLISLPLRLRGRVWGVLVVEDLPFENYSLYTENLLEILVLLAEPYLTQSADFAEQKNLSEVDQDTGLPLYSQLLVQLGLSLEGAGPGPLSLLVFEIANFDELLKTWTRPALKGLLLVILRAFEERNQLKLQAFHFSEDRQLAVIIRGRDQDGLSFLGLDLLTSIHDLGLTLEGKPVPIEAIVGFGTSVGPGTTVKHLVDSAESLLRMQRL